MWSYGNDHNDFQISLPPLNLSRFPYKDHLGVLSYILLGEIIVDLFFFKERLFGRGEEFKQYFGEEVP